MSCTGKGTLAWQKLTWIQVSRLLELGVCPWTSGEESPVLKITPRVLHSTHIAAVAQMHSLIAENVTGLLNSRVADGR